MVSKLNREGNPDGGKVVRFFAALMIFIILLLIVFLTTYLFWFFSGETGQFYEYIDDGWLPINIVITIFSFALIWFKWGESFESKINRISAAQNEIIQIQTEHLDLGHKTHNILSAYLNGIKMMEMKPKSYLSQYIAATKQAQTNFEKLSSELSQLVLMDINQLKTYFSNHRAEEVYEYCSH